ncbi:hypothetical protein [Novosphingobium sp. MMS21-SN21R]|uniref:hypothetical protein n=1 Tax=Novosphingobium sp. MMS21-SN21R TaxID=2969298 RepID=UPI0028876A57|nr:hypothetical protein [Novosphingobium sp. MMS21-SN21R]MDT0508567.1 hypothetical protein [Novosphingobium sp. MMS21-SN21R]
MAQSAADLAKLRQRQWANLQPAIARTPALAAYAGKPLAQFPITQIEGLRRDYGAWNSLGLGDADLRRLADASESGKAGEDLTAGWSTGSSGCTRGLFVASKAERADYIGQSLARLLPFSALLRSQRLALHLRASNALYSDAGRRRMGFAHFPLDLPIHQTAAALAQYSPTILIAPPSRLLAMASAGISLPRLQFLFFGSEPMSAAESECVSAHFGIRPGAIFQATEGFLGAECREGRLHLNDHALEIELQPVPGTDGFRPVITDLRRASQPIVRVAGDDFIELDAQPCRCGFAGQVIRAVQGRVVDIWPISGRHVTPPQVVAAVESELGALWRWQAVACADRTVLSVQSDCSPDIGHRACAALERLTGRSTTLSRDLSEWTGPKRRKVVWSGG